LPSKNTFLLTFVGLVSATVHSQTPTVVLAMRGVSRGKALLLSLALASSSVVHVSSDLQTDRQHVAGGLMSTAVSLTDCTLSVVVGLQLPQGSNAAKTPSHRSYYIHF
jgi:hypothetical protein